MSKDTKREPLSHTPSEWNDPSVWSPPDVEEAKLISAGALKRLEVNGAPVTEQSHEFVLRKPPHASNR